MADPEHLAILGQGVEAWNAWRKENRKLKPDLFEADLRGADLRGAQLREADLRRSNLARVDLSRTRSHPTCLLYADLRGTDLSGARLVKTDLRRVFLGQGKLRGADLQGANLRWASLQRTDLTGANLQRAVLYWSLLEQTKLDGADMTGAFVYGTAVWRPELRDTIQDNMVATYRDEPTVTVDSLELAQFVYLLLRNEKIREVIDTVTSKVVLILGRFSKPRKAVLDAVRDELHRRNLTPVVFDFDKPASKDVTGTVETLARMARYIIADLTDPSSIPHELATIVPFLRTTPVLPIRLAGSGGYGMFRDYSAYPWVLPISEYDDGPTLIQALPAILEPADAMADSFRRTEDEPPSS